MHVRVGPAVLALVVFAAMAPLLPAASASDPVQILDVDTAPRTIEPGGTAVFEWTVRNLDALPYNVSATVSAPPGWSGDVAPSQLVDLAPLRAATVRLTVQAPDSVLEETTAAFVVRFLVADGGAAVFVASKNATVTIPSSLAEKRVLGLFANPMPSPLDNEWGVFALDVALWLAIALALRFLVAPGLKSLTKRTKTQIDDIVLRTLKTPLAVLLFLYGTLNSLSSLDAHLPPWLIDGALFAYAAGSTLVFFYVGFRIFRDVILHVGRDIARRTSSNVDDVLMPIVEKVGYVVMGLAAFGLLLGFLRVDITLFVAGGVVTSMVIAFAAQDTLSNFFAGIFLLSDRPFKVGDTVILADGDWVEVRQIGMRTTRFFRFSDAAVVTIPNNKLVNEKLANFTNPADQGRVSMKFSAAYGSDPAHVKDLILSVIAKNPNILKEDPFKPIVRFDALADSSLVFFMLVWIDDRNNRFAVQESLNAGVYAAFGAAGVEIPFPQQTVHFRLDAVEPAGVERAAERLRSPPARETRAPAVARPEGGATIEARTGQADIGTATRAVEPSETVGELFEALVKPAASVPESSTLAAAVRSMLAVPFTRKVYVVDDSSKPIGTVTIEDVMRHVSHRLGAREGGVTSLFRFIREMESDHVENFMRTPTPVTAQTRLIEVARRIVDKKLNDFPVVDAQGKLIGELNALRLLENVLGLLERGPPGDAPGTGAAPQ